MLLHYVSRKQNDWDQTVAVPVYGYNTQVHSSTGLSPFELVLSRPPPVPIMEVRPIVREGKTKAGFRKEFLLRLWICLGMRRRVWKRHRLGTRQCTTPMYARGTLRVYPETWSSSRRSRTLDGSLQNFCHQRQDPITWIARTEHSFKVRTAQRDVWVQSDRVTKAPTPEDHPDGVRYVSDSDDTDDDSGQELEYVGDTTEFVVERLVSHEYRNGGDLYFKVRWFGYDPEEDTWELWDSLPEAMVMKYMRKKKMIPTP
jgi:Chromo (CHRromatin Organisation MOdifier) domain